MEPVTLATTIVALMFTEAIKQPGKALGEAATEKITQLITTIREKFKVVKREGILADAEQEPTPDNQSEFKRVLEQQITKDRDFAEKLTELVQQLEAAGVFRQKMLTDVETEETLEAGNLTQKSKLSGSGDQEMAKNLKAKNIKFGDLTQEI
ncbi:MAG: hypothetical protein RMZ69_09780 [Nostoc sp. ChiQUE01a]|nr:hypothetical protein [Nostoc sp. ChiQUE01a]